MSGLIVNDRTHIEDYLETKNPIHMWRMIAWCIRNKQPFPAEVNNYLLTTADALENVPPGKGYRDRVAKAIGFKDGRVLNARTYYQDYSIYEELKALRVECKTIPRAIEKYREIHPDAPGFDTLEDIFQRVQRCEKFENEPWDITE